MSEARNSFGLTNQQEAFAQAVITTKTLSDAYRSAYDCSNMATESINVNASKEAKHTKVALRVAELRDRASRAADVSLDRWYREQARLAFPDIAGLYNQDGTIKPIHEMSDDAKAIISGIDIEYPGGEDAPVMVVKIKQHSKNQALDQLGRALGAYEKDNKQKNDIIPEIPDDIEWDNEENEEK